MGLKGFWSYVHADDTAEGERISSLARDVTAQYELLTGESIELFLDRDALQWGDDWRGQIDSSLASIAFFIPILTPRYFQSSECRREANTFIRRATELGLTELLMPILYVDVPGLHDDEPDDDLIRLIKQFQWEDWRQIRFEETTAASYRRGVAGLAERLVRANTAAESLDLSILPDSDQTGDQDDRPGDLETIDRAEDAMAEWVDTLQSIGEEIERIGQIVQNAAPDLQSQDAQRSTKKRLSVLRRLSKELSTPATKVSDFGQQFATQLHDIDTGIQLALGRLPQELENGETTLEDVCDFFSTLRNFAAGTNDALQGIEDMIDSMAPVERLSRDMRPVLRALRSGLTNMLDGRELINSWVGLIENTGVDCQDVNT